MKHFFLVLLSFKILFAYEDLGTYGELKDIKERDLMELFIERANALDYTKLENEIKSNIQKSFIIKSNIPTCTQSKQRTYEPLVDITEDVKVPYTDFKIKEKNTKYNILKENNLFIPFNVMFIDANDELQVELARYYKKQLGSKLEIFIVKGDILSLQKESYFDEVKLAREGLETKAFNVECIPSIYTQKEYQFEIVEYAPKDLKKDKDEVKK